MKKGIRKTDKSVYLRYEFSDESGRPEGGDIFQFSSLPELQKLIGQVIDVAQSDGVTVGLTIGQGSQFFEFLNNNGISKKEVEKEMVDLQALSASDAESSPGAKKSAPKSTKKSTKKVKATKKKTRRT